MIFEKKKNEKQNKLKKKRTYYSILLKLAVCYRWSVTISAKVGRKRGKSVEIRTWSTLHVLSSHCNAIRNGVRSDCLEWAWHNCENEMNQCRSNCWNNTVVDVLSYHVEVVAKSGLSAWNKSIQPRFVFIWNVIRGRGYFWQYCSTIVYTHIYVFIHTHIYIYIIILHRG